MGGRSVLAIERHAAAIKQTVQIFHLMRKTPTILLRGPMPIANNLGIGMAVDMLYNLLSARPHLKGETCMQFNLMCHPRATFTSACESSPAGIEEDQHLPQVQ
jgi:hypothetical protein